MTLSLVAARCLKPLQEEVFLPYHDIEHTLPAFQNAPCDADQVMYLNGAFWRLALLKYLIWYVASSLSVQIHGPAPNLKSLGIPCGCTTSLFL